MKTINNFLQEKDRSFEKKDSVKAIVSDDKGNILILRRANNEGGGGNFDVPGGAIEKGENKFDALKREVFEETNLKINEIKFLTSFVLKIPETGINSELNIYTANTKGTDVKLKPATWKGSNGTPEHTEFKWINKKLDLENLPMLPQLKKIVMKELKD